MDVLLHWLGKATSKLEIAVSISLININVMEDLRNIETQRSILL